MKAYLALLGAVVAISGCAKNGGSATPPTAGTASLEGKSILEVLQIKYNKAQLKCDLWTQQSLALDLSGAPSDSVLLDLKANPAMPLKLKLTGQIRNHLIGVDLNIVSLDLISRLRHVDEKGNVVVVQNSPAVKVEYAVRSATSLGPGETTLGDGSVAHEVYEGITDVGYNVSVPSKPTVHNGVTVNNGDFRDYVQCTIATDVKPAYR